MKRLDSLSLVTQQISVKGGTWAPGCFCFNHQHPSRGHLTLRTRSSRPFPLCSVCYLQYLVSSSAERGMSKDPRRPPRPSLLSHTSAALMKRVVPNILLHTGNSPNALPAAAGVRVEGQTYKRHRQVFFFVNFGQKGARYFTVALHSTVFNEK